LQSPFCFLCQLAVPAPPVEDNDGEPNIQVEAGVDDGNQETLYLSDYVRGPNSSSQCIFNDCQNVERQRIPDMIRVMVLRTQRLFIPEHARACTEHLQSYEWPSLLERCNVYYVKYLTCL
jgi:hypothetical protein